MVNSDIELINGDKINGKYSTILLSELLAKRKFALIENAEENTTKYRKDWLFKKIPKIAPKVLPVLLSLIPFPCEFTAKDGNLFVCFPLLESGKLESVKQIMEKYFLLKKKKYMDNVIFMPDAYYLNNDASIIVILK